MKKTTMIGVVLALVALMAMSVSAVPFTAADVTVEIDGVEIDNGAAVNKLNLERGNDFTVRVVLDANAITATDNIEVHAFVSGYEYNDIDSISDTTGVFSVEPDTTYVKRLRLAIPNDVDEDDYRLRVLVSDRNSDALILDYNLKLDVVRNDMRIEDVVFNPEGQVKAGRSLLTLVRVENSGERDQEGVKVSAAIPALGVSASDYIDEVDSDDEVTSEALYFRIPACAEPGVYNVEVTMTYDSGRRSENKLVPITVLEDERCSAAPSSATPAQPEKTVIAVGPSNQEAAAGSSAVFPVTLTNAGSTTKTYTLTVEGAQGWSTTKLTPSNVVVLEAGQTKAAYVSVTPEAGATAGEHTFVVTVTHNGEVLQQLPATVTVAAAAAEPVAAQAVGWEKVKRGLEIGLVVLVVLLVILGLIVAFNKMKNDEDEEDSQNVETGQTYY